MFIFVLFLLIVIFIYMWGYFWGGRDREVGFFGGILEWIRVIAILEYIRINEKALLILLICRLLLPVKSNAIQKTFY